MFTYLLEGTYFLLKQAFSYTKLLALCQNPQFQCYLTFNCSESYLSFKDQLKLYLTP